MELRGTGWSINLGGSSIDSLCPTLVALAPDDPPLPVLLPQLPLHKDSKVHLHQSEGWRNGQGAATLLCSNLPICRGDL